MKSYLKNLLIALKGRNPYQEELDEKNRRLQKVADHNQSLHDQLYAALNNWDGCRLLLEDAEKKCASLQQLVENLRDRIKDKDAEIEQMRQEYDKRVATYEEDTN